MQPGCTKVGEVTARFHSFGPLSFMTLLPSVPTLCRLHSLATSVGGGRRRRRRAHEAPLPPFDLLRALLPGPNVGWWKPGREADGRRERQRIAVASAHRSASSVKKESSRPLAHCRSRQWRPTVGALPTPHSKGQQKPTRQEKNCYLNNARKYAGVVKILGPTAQPQRVRVVVAGSVSV